MEKLTITNENAQLYIDLGLLDPNLQIDLNVHKTTTDSNRKVLSILDALKGGYKFNFNYELKPVKLKLKVINLPELEVVAAKPKPKSAFKDTYGSGNPIWGTRRVENMRKASPNVMDNWRVAENVAEGINVLSGGILNRSSPSLNLRLIYDIANGKDFWDSWFGNSGVVPEGINPYLPFGINTLFDAGFGYGSYRFGKWGITPKLVGSGAEFDVYSAPFSRTVTKIGDVTPSEAALKSSIPATIPLKYKGRTPEGLYKYTQRKAVIPKTMPKLRTRMKLYNKIMEGRKYFPGNYDGQTKMLDFISKDKAITDLGLGNIGYRNLFDYVFKRLPVIIDNAVLDIPDYLALYLKGGGKLIPKAKSGIKIKKENRGKFTEYCNGKVTNECILKAKNSGNPKLVKRAIFALNARKWKHK